MEVNIISCGAGINNGESHSAIVRKWKMRIFVRQFPQADSGDVFIERVVTPYAAGTYADNLHGLTEIRAEMAAHSVAFF